jgi:hypothetical protein
LHRMYGRGKSQACHVCFELRFAIRLLGRQLIEPDDSILSFYTSNCSHISDFFSFESTHGIEDFELWINISTSSFFV